MKNLKVLQAQDNLGEGYLNFMFSLLNFTITLESEGISLKQCKGQVSDLVDLTTSPTNTPFLTFCLILNLG